MSRTKLESLGGGRFRVSGVLDASTVTDLLKQSVDCFAGVASIEVDLAGVTEGDSAGLALLIEWLRAVRHGGGSIRFVHVPPQIGALARISEVEDLLLTEVAGTADASAAERAVSA